jgi:hypothetical protein
MTAAAIILVVYGICAAFVFWHMYHAPVTDEFDDDEWNGN